MEMNEFTNDTGIAVVADRMAIADLFGRYAFHFDRNEPDSVASLFTDDAIVDYGPEFPPIEGRAAMAERIRPGLDDVFAATSHHISNVLVDFPRPGVAQAVAYVHAWHRYIDGSPDGYLWGQYHVAARRDDGEWRFSRLRLEVVEVIDFHRSVMHRAHRNRPGHEGPTPD